MRKLIIMALFLQSCKYMYIFDDGKEKEVVLGQSFGREWMAESATDKNGKLIPGSINSKKPFNTKIRRDLKGYNEFQFCMGDSIMHKVDDKKNEARDFSKKIKKDAFILFNLTMKSGDKYTIKYRGLNLDVRAEKRYCEMSNLMKYPYKAENDTILYKMLYMGTGEAN
jgi:hypothetical protein